MKTREHHKPTGTNKTDAGNGSKAICRVSNVLRSPSPDPSRWRFRTRHPTMSDYFEQLEGEQLSSVTFVMDYIQLHFGGPSINVYMPMSVEAGATTIRSGDNQFRNALCGQIAKIVRSISFRDAEALNITFLDDSRLSISLRHEDYSGPEALEAHDFRDAPIIIV